MKGQDFMYLDNDHMYIVEDFQLYIQMIGIEYWIKL
jgi:hypothetical protein